MSSTVLREVRYDDARIEDVLTDVLAKGRAVNPQLGVRGFRLPEEFERRPAASPPDSLPRATLELRDVTLRQVLQCVADIAGLTLEVRGDGVLCFAQDLPPALRARLAREPSAASSLRRFTCSDGVECLVDDAGMSLWYRKAKGAPWQCIVTNVHIEKTAGGSAPELPVLYAGRERFLVAKTVRGSGRHAPSGSGSEPRADCVVYLIDARNGAVIDRTQRIEYDHNPQIQVPDEWMSKHKLVLESAPK